MEGHGTARVSIAAKVAGGARVLTPSGPRPALDLFHAPTPQAAHDVRPHRRMRTVSRLLLALAALQILDLVSTLLLLSIGGQEVNPIAAWTLRQGVPAFVGLKVGLALLLAAFVPLLERPQPPDGVRTATWACFGADLLFGGAVVSNLAQFALFA